MTVIGKLHSTAISSSIQTFNSDTLQVCLKTTQTCGIPHLFRSSVSLYRQCLMSLSRQQQQV